MCDAPLPLPNVDIAALRRKLGLEITITTARDGLRPRDVILGPLATPCSRLLAAMVGTALVALAVAYLLVGHLQEARQHSKDQARADQIAAALSERVGFDLRSDSDDLDTSHLAAYQSLLPNDQVVIRRNGRVLFSGPVPPSRTLELSTSARFPGGTVTVRDYTGSGGGRSVTATEVGAAVAAAVIGAAIVVATLLTRAVREPVRRAITAADRVAAGDLSARMGTTERAEAQELIQHESGRVRALLDDLRELAPGPGRNRAPAAARPRRTVRADRSARDAQAAGVTLEVRVSASTIVSDERLLDMILSNLVANAIRYTPPGGRVMLSARRQRHELVLAVIDTGIGIDPRHQERIFERLYRVESARSRDQRGSGLDDDRVGSGLGLPIAQRRRSAGGSSSPANRGEARSSASCCPSRILTTGP